jgi:hypothetical protein
VLLCIHWCLMISYTTGQCSLYCIRMQQHVHKCTAECMRIGQDLDLQLARYETVLFANS